MLKSPRHGNTRPRSPVGAADVEQQQRIQLRNPRAKVEHERRLHDGPQADYMERTIQLRRLLPAFGNALVTWGQGRWVQNLAHRLTVTICS